MCYRDENKAINPPRCYLIFSLHPRAKSYTRCEKKEPETQSHREKNAKVGERVHKLSSVPVLSAARPGACAQTKKQENNSDNKPAQPDPNTSSPYEKWKRAENLQKANG